MKGLKLFQWYPQSFSHPFVKEEKTRKHAGAQEPQKQLAATGESLMQILQKRGPSFQQEKFLKLSKINIRRLFGKG